MKVLRLGEIVSFEYSTDSPRGIGKTDCGVEIDLDKYILVEVDELKDLLRIKRDNIKKEKYMLDKRKRETDLRIGKISADLNEVSMILEDL